MSAFVLSIDNIVAICYLKNRSGSQEVKQRAVLGKAPSRRAFSGRRMKMRRFWKIAISALLFCVILSQISLTVFAAPPTEPESTNDIAITSVTSGTTDPLKHDPVTDIFDGAIYYLRNAANGTYMDVDNEETESGTNISTYQFHGKTNQQFRFHYIGKNLYELNPMNSPTMCVRAAEYADGTNVDMHYSSNTRTRFRVTPLGGGKYTLCSESRNFTDAVCFDTEHPNNVVQKTTQT